MDMIIRWRFILIRYVRLFYFIRASLVERFLDKFHFVDWFCHFWLFAMV